jgi:hypothetical protein
VLLRRLERSARPERRRRNAVERLERSCSYCCPLPSACCLLNLLTIGTTGTERSGGTSGTILFLLLAWLLMGDPRPQAILARQVVLQIDISSGYPLIVSDRKAVLRSQVRSFLLKVN